MFYGFDNAGRGFFILSYLLYLHSLALHLFIIANLKDNLSIITQNFSYNTDLEIHHRKIIY